MLYLPCVPTRGLTTTSMVALSSFSSRNLTSAGPLTEQSTEVLPKKKEIKHRKSSAIENSIMMKYNYQN
jgi:hypothetical protein